MKIKGHSKQLREKSQGIVTKIIPTPWTSHCTAHTKHLNTRVNGPPSLSVMDQPKSKQQKQNFSDDEVDVLFGHRWWGNVCLDSCAVAKGTDTMTVWNYPEANNCIVARSLPTETASTEKVWFLWQKSSQLVSLSHVAVWLGWLPSFLQDAYARKPTF